jgi:hypothetical protein
MKEVRISLVNDAIKKIEEEIKKLKDSSGLCEEKEFTIETVYSKENKTQNDRIDSLIKNIHNYSPPKKYITHLVLKLLINELNLKQENLGKDINEYFNSSFCTSSVFSNIEEKNENNSSVTKSKSVLSYMKQNRYITDDFLNYFESEFEKRCSLLLADVFSRNKSSETYDYSFSPLPSSIRKYTSVYFCRSNPLTHPMLFGKEALFFNDCLRFCFNECVVAEVNSGFFFFFYFFFICFR